jgi:hypothetical protein
MTHAVPSTSPTVALPLRAPAASETKEVRRTRMRQSRVIGALFLAGFLAYGVGSSIATSIVGRSGFLADVPPVQSLLALGAFLILLNTAVDLGKAVLLYPILHRHSERTALAYFATMIAEVVFLTTGALALFLVVPLAQRAGEPGAQTLGSTLVDLNATSYQVGEMVLGVGATFLCALLLRTRLVPRWLAVSGLIGYPLLVVGTIAELFGVHIGLALTMPGFFFELALPIWLLTKGFDPQAYGGPTSARSAA